MKKPFLLTLTLSGLMIGGVAVADQNCTYLPEDIPQPLALTVSLAGSAEPDVGRFLSVQSARSGKLSRDGSVLAYLGNASGTPQIWISSRQQPWPKQITFGEPITFFDWAPDGRLVYGVDRDGNEREGFYLLTPDGLHEEQLLAPADAFRYFGGFTPDMSSLVYATTARDPDMFDIHMLDLQTSQDQMVLQGRMGLYVDSVSPDGSAIILSESSGEDSHILYLLDVATGQLHELFPGNQDRSRMDQIHWLEDSSGFYFVTNLGREFSGIALYDLSKMDISWIYQANREVEELVTSNPQNMLAWTELSGGFGELMMMSMEGGTPNAVQGLPAGSYSIQAAQATGDLAVSVSGPRVPGDIWIVDKAGSVQRMTESAHAGLNLDDLVSPTHVTIPARDGIQIYGLLYLPDVPQNRQIPFLIAVHGGPTAYAAPTFDGAHQYLLSRGIGILDLNFRGSSGYGKSFARLNDQRLRENELYDLEDAANWLKQDSGLPVARVGIAGASYGGYLTMAALARLPHVFDAGVAMVGVSNWITALEGASPSLKASDRIEYGDIDNAADRDFFRTISPVNYAQQVTAPLMLQHGANDPRDPPAESDHFACAVRANGATVEYLRFPDEGHGLRRQVNRITFYTRMAEFLKRHLGAE